MACYPARGSVFHRLSYTSSICRFLLTFLSKSEFACYVNLETSRVRGLYTIIALRLN